MSAVRLFESFKRLATKDEIAQQIALDTIEEHEAARVGRETEPLDVQDMERLQRLAALLTGPRREAVKPIVAQRWPEFAKVCDKEVGHA